MCRADPAIPRMISDHGATLHLSLPIFPQYLKERIANMTTDAELRLNPHNPYSPLPLVAPVAGRIMAPFTCPAPQLKIGRYVRLDASVTYGSMSLKPLALKYSGVSNAEAPARS